MMLVLILCQKYWSLVDTDMTLGKIFANAPIVIRAMAQEDRLQILKTLEDQAAPDAVVSKSPDVQNPQNKRQMSEPVLHPPDVQDPQINCQCLGLLLICQMHRILKISCQCLSRLLTLLLNVTVSPVDSQGASLKGMANADWLFGVGANEKRAFSLSLCTVLSPEDKINTIPLQ